MASIPPPPPFLTLLFVSLLSLQATACDSKIPKRSAAADASADASARFVDASTEVENFSAAITPAQGFVGVDGTIQFEAKLLDPLGKELVSGAIVTWSVDEDSLATVSPAGVVTGLSPGDLLVTARIDTVVASVRVDVFGDLAGCCDLSMSQSLSNFCSVDPATSECPMTLAGGACDPDGDGDYDELSESLMGEMQDFFSEQCTEPVCVIDDVPNVLIDCSSVYDPTNRQWRCVELTTVFPGRQASQICQDMGSGPKWYTYNLDPTDCCECDLQNLPSPEVPLSCVCAGSNC